MSRGRLAAALAAVALVIAGCGDDDTAETTEVPTTTEAEVDGEPAPAPPSTDTTPGGDETTVAPTTVAPTTAPPTTAAPTTTEATTTTLAADCPGDGALPGDAQAATLAGADVDGDGDVDTVHAYATGDPDAPNQWWLQVSFSGGGGTALAVDDDSVLLSGVRAFDGIDVDGDGTEEIFAKVGAGASVEILGLFDVADCTLRRVTLDGLPSMFAIGGSINFVNGIACTGDRLHVLSGQRLGDTTDFEITDVQYALGDGALEFEFADGGGANEGDADFDRFRAADCPGISLF